MTELDDLLLPYSIDLSIYQQIDNSNLVEHIQRVGIIFIKEKIMNKDIAIKVENLSKIYKLYNAPIDRMKEALHPRKNHTTKNFMRLMM